MNPRHVIVRADASRDIGAGHMMRGLAIAEAIRAAGASVSFVTCKLPIITRQQLTAERGFDVIELDTEAGTRADACALSKHAAELNAAVLLDGHHFDDIYEKELDSAGLRLAVMDDACHAKHLRAGMIINGNLYYANARRYADVRADAKLLLGPDYAALRPEFVRQRTRRVAKETVSNVLVTFGGADSQNATETALDVLLRIVGECSVKVVIGGVATCPASERRNPVSGKQTVYWLDNVTDMAPLMAWADLAISAGGATSYELAYMGVPMLLAPATNVQAPVSDELERIGAAKNLGLAEAFPDAACAEALRSLVRAQKRRQDMIDSGQALFDGRGAERISRALLADNWG